MSFERFGNLRVPLMPSAAQQAAVCRVLHQRVLEAVHHVGWRASLENQLGGNEAGKSRLQFVLG
jgi:hypothetical protein